VAAYTDILAVTAEKVPGHKRKMTVNTARDINAATNANGARVRVKGL
jgi:hypothetical protein